MRLRCTGVFFVVAAAMFFTYPSLRPTIFAKSSNRKINNPQTIQNPPQPHPEFGVPAPQHLQHVLLNLWPNFEPICRLSLRQLALLFSKVKHEGLYAAWIYQDAPSMHNKFL